MVSTRSQRARGPAAGGDLVSTPAKTAQVARPTTYQDSKLLQLPVEILQEVLSLADLIELLGWSYTCRDLNDWLTSRRSKQIWQNALVNMQYMSKRYTPITLPPCPQKITPFCHAKLLFSRRCIFCKDPYAVVHCAYTSDGYQNVCTTCDTTVMVSKKHLKSTWKSKKLSRAFWDALPFQPLNTAGGPDVPIHALAECESFLAKYQEQGAKVKFRSEHLTRIIKILREEETEMLSLVEDLLNWPELYHDLIEGRERRHVRQRRKSKVLLEEVVREDIFKRSLKQNPSLLTSDITSALQVSPNLKAFLQNLQRPMSTADWAQIQVELLPAAERIAAARKEFVSIFNPQAVNSRAALKPYWSESIARFTKKEECAVMPTLYEFSALPALSVLQQDFFPERATIDSIFNENHQDYDTLKGRIDTDLAQYSEKMLLQLAKKLSDAETEVTLSEALAQLQHPTAVFACTSCWRTFEGVKILHSSHPCAGETRLPELQYAALGRYYADKSFSVHLQEELGGGSPLRFPNMARLPIRTLSHISLSKERSMDMLCILDLLQAHNIGIPAPVTRKNLDKAAAELTFICELCETRSFHCARFKGVSALLEHFKVVRDAPWQYAFHDENGGRLRSHERLRLAGQDLK